MPSSTPSFQFNEALNSDFLLELYGEDLSYAAIIFEDVAGELPKYWRELEQAYEDNDVALLKGAAHKCKTLYAYVGFSGIESLLQSVETGCQSASRAQDLSVEIEKLYVQHPVALALLLGEVKRLKECS